eukprot:1331116-Karenia_brevis.AAC.1
MFDFAYSIGRLLLSRARAEELLRAYLREITTGADRVILFSGSNRQTAQDDAYNAAQNDNG